MLPLAEQVFRVSARVAGPVNGHVLPDDAIGPLFGTAVGLVAYGAKPRDTSLPVVEEKRGFEKVRHRMVGWIREFF